MAEFSFVNNELGKLPKLSFQFVDKVTGWELKDIKIRTSGRVACGDNTL